MKIYLAPLQGLTDRIFRTAYNEQIGVFDKSFSPFIRVQGTEFYRPSQCNDILPVHNTIQRPIPQFLGNTAASFERFEALCHENGYTEANLNMGCPFPILMGKKMGAGILKHPEMVGSMLEGIFSKTQLKLSVKCRLGMENAAEFEQLIPIFNSFPLLEMIIHPRVGKQQYKGEVDLNAFSNYAAQIQHPICYNGDILIVEDISKIKTVAPQVESVMIGRGILQNPFLLGEIRGEHLTIEEKKKRLHKFHTEMIALSKLKYSGDLSMLKRFEELWSYHHLAFENGRKVYKAVKKSNSMEKYETAVFGAIADIGMRSENIEGQESDF